MPKTSFRSVPVVTLTLKPLGRVLKRAGLVSAQQLNRALQTQAQASHLKIGEILAQQGTLKSSTANFFADQLPLLLQQPNKQLLGQYLKAADLLDDQQVGEILQDQQQTELKFGEIAVDKGWIQQDTINFFLKYFYLQYLQSETSLDHGNSATNLASNSTSLDKDRGSPPQIFLSPPHMGNHELSYVQKAFEANWIAPVGPHVDAFEEEFCQVVGASNAAALSSATAALHLALRLLGVESGDEIFCSTLTFVAAANPILYLGAKPVFVDSDRISWNMDPHLLTEALAQRARSGKLPKAVIVVHLYGQSADIEPILEICNYYGIPLIEDAAESLGATYYGRATGTFGRIGIYSFNGNKIITTSGGGMLISEDVHLVTQARFLATQARDPAPHYQHSQVGYNYRLSNVLAGIGRGQLRVLEQRIAARRLNFKRYEQALGHLPGISFMPNPSFGRSTRWLTCLTINEVDFGVTREDVRKILLSRNIESRPVWKPLHLQPIFAGCDCIGGKVSEGLFKHGLCLPSGSNMTDADLNRVVSAITSHLL